MTIRAAIASSIVLMFAVNSAGAVLPAWVVTDWLGVAGKGVGAPVVSSRGDSAGGPGSGLPDEPRPSLDTFDGAAFDAVLTAGGDIDCTAVVAGLEHAARTIPTAASRPTGAASGRRSP
ncbi:MAG: hypothetical protein ABJD68_15755 [Nakamurella sp.]